MPAMTKTRQDAEAYEAGLIARADHFTAFIQAAPGERYNEGFPTKEAAVGRAQEMANHFGRKAMVYAVTAEGRSAHVCNISPAR